jgi:anti-sigma factor RsiW
MDHEQTRELLHPYVDGELDLPTARETEKHLRDCPDCRGVERAIRGLREAVTSGRFAYRAPSHLRRNIRAALRRENHTESFLALADLCHRRSLRFDRSVSGAVSNHSFISQQHDC